MLKLNNKKYSKVSYQVSFGEYKVKQNGKERTGKSPRITFMLEDFHLMLEFIYDKEWIKKIKINDKKEISSYLTDIMYSDSKGWLSLIYGKFRCYLERINDKDYFLDFYCNVIEDEEEFNILLNEIIDFTKET